MLSLKISVIKLDNKFLEFELVTQEGILVADKVTKVKVHTSLGGLTILPNHAEIKSDIKPGTMKVSFYDSSKEDVKYTLSEGVLEASPNKITVIAQTAKVKEEVDPYKL